MPPAENSRSHHQMGYKPFTIPLYHLVSLLLTHSSSFISSIIQSLLSIDSSHLANCFHRHKIRNTFCPSRRCLLCHSDPGSKGPRGDLHCSNVLGEYCITHRNFFTQGPFKLHRKETATTAITKIVQTCRSNASTRLGDAKSASGPEVSALSNASTTTATPNI